MCQFQPYITADGSVGLYNSDVKDIYHSATGALTESYEKFIYPVDFDILLSNSRINVLDICYGIGYNSKSFLNFILEKFSKKYKNNSCYVPIYTDKQINKKLTTYNDKIYSDKIFSKISVTAVDNDKILSYLSPIIKTGILNCKNQRFNFDHSSIDKYLSNKSGKKIKINKIINFLILNKIMQNPINPDIENDLANILSNPEFKMYFDNDLKGIFRAFMSQQCKLHSHTTLISNLHNIYYRYISYCYKNKLKAYNLQEINFNIKNLDARLFIKGSNEMYNLIFLDAFSPNKCPCLWTYDFFKELYSHLHENGTILTYSSAASVRNAFLHAGFKIGNIYNERLNKNIGTIAAKNSDLIKYPLSEFDFGLLKTRAGIFYRDETLTGQNEPIISRRNEDVRKSNLMSSSKYIKQFARNIK